MVKGQRHVQRIPRDWVEEVQQRVAAGREFQDAVREVLAANAQLLVLARQQRKKKKEEAPLKSPTPRRLWKYISQHLHLAAYFRSPGDGRSSHKIPAKDLLWSNRTGHDLAAMGLSGH